MTSAPARTDAARYAIVTTTLPPGPAARELARALVDARLAACVQIEAPITSLYRWHGAFETAEELRLTIKTRRDRLDALGDFIRARHPYETPEIVATPIAWGDRRYLAWIDASLDETPPAG